MGTASFVLVGTVEAEQASFASTCHGAGRTLSRTQARKRIDGRELARQLEGQGITLAPGSPKLLAEEAPLAYKDVDEVVDRARPPGRLAASRGSGRSVS